MVAGPITYTDRKGGKRGKNTFHCKSSEQGNSKPQWRVNFNMPIFYSLSASGGFGKTGVWGEAGMPCA